MVALGIAALIVANLADYLTFLFMVMTHGLSAEGNPLVVTLAQDHGLVLLTIAKAAAVLLVATVFLVVVRSRPKLATGVLALGILIGGIGAISNIASI